MIYLRFEVLYCQEGQRKYTKHHDWCDIMWWCCDVERTLMTSWIIKRGLTILRAHQWLSVQGEEADKDICLCLAHPASLVIKGSGQNKAKLNQNMAIICTYIFQQKIFIKWGNYDLVFHWLWYIWYSFLFLFYSELPNSASPIWDFINIEYWKLWMCEIKERTA